MTLRELVAVEVMGWHEIVGGWGRWYESDGSHAVLDNDWFPDISMDDAMYWVVKHMRAKGWLFRIDDSGNDRTKTTVWFQKASDGFVLEAEGVASGKVGEEPELVYLAALRACGVSEDRIEQARKGNA